MQNVMQIATNAGHTAQNDCRTAQNDGRTTQNDGRTAQNDGRNTLNPLWPRRRKIDVLLYLKETQCKKIEKYHFFT